MNFEDLSNAIIKGRNIVLKENGLDPFTIDSADDNKLMQLIQERPYRDKKKDNYFISLAKNKFLPKKTADGGISFTPYYDKAQTSGDSAEIAMHLLEIGRGKNAKREVSTIINNHKKYNIFDGYNEDIKITNRKSDLVVYHDDGTNNHVEIKVGLTANNKLQNLRQELYGDMYRLDHDSKTRQTYVIFRNGINGLSQQNSKEYMSYLETMKHKYGKRVSVIVDGKEIDRPLQAYVGKPIEQQIQIDDNKLIIGGKLCNLSRTGINEEIDHNIRIVNNCDSLPRSDRYNSIIESRSKVDNFKRAYNFDLGPSAKFLSGFKDGIAQGARYSFVHGSVSAILSLMKNDNYEKDNCGKIIRQVITNTAQNAIRCGLVSGASNLAKTLTGKKVNEFVANSLCTSIGSFKDFCKGSIGVNDLLTSIVKPVAISSGLIIAKTIGSTFINNFMSVGATAPVMGTSSLIGIAGGALCSIGLAFIGACIFSLLIRCGDNSPSVNDTIKRRYTSTIRIDDSGRCVIENGMSRNTIDLLVEYNNKLDELERINSMRQRLKSIENKKREETILALKNDVEYLRCETIRQAEKISFTSSMNFENEAKELIASYIESKMFSFNIENAKINDIREFEKRLYNGQKQCDYITKCCNQIIELSSSTNNFENDNIKEIVNSLANVASNNSFSFTSNSYTTSSDILKGCLGVL